MPKPPQPNGPATPGDAASRLRRLAGRLAEGRAPAELEREIAAALDRWEQALGEGPGADSPAGSGDAADTVPAGAIRIWCDGSCAPNPGPGGWGAIVERDGRRVEMSGTAAEATNNTMEMTAAIEALRRTPEGSEVQVTTDSRYLVDGITRWIHSWKRKGWRKSDGKPVLNRELWQKLDGLTAARRVSWKWVRGHAGHAENERCDELANEARREMERSS